MNVIQRCWYLTVRDCGQAGFLAEGNYADTWTDRSLILEVERGTLQIKNAHLEVRRGEPGFATEVPLPSLVGITAYFGCGKPLRQALAGDQVIFDMASQTITAVIQAEAFFYQERGFSSAEAYDDFWDQTSLDSCSYYSNLDRVTTRFMEGLKGRLPGTNLFHRFLATSFNFSDNFEIRGQLMDSFHEMSLSLKLDPNFRIEKVSADMSRCPDIVCREALDTLNALEGMPLTVSDVRKYQKTSGGASGCTHIGHLAQEAALTLEMFKRNKVRTRS